MMDMEILDSLLDPNEKAVTYQATVEKDYDRLARWSNTTSYSLLSLLHTCARKFALVKHRAAKNLELFGDTDYINLDLVFGHAVGSGVQNYLATGSKNQALINTFMAWKVPYDERHDRGKKSLWEAWLAVESFISWWDLRDEWELVYIDGLRGRVPSIELTVGIHAEDGFRHYIHIDAVLRHKRTGDISIGEFKTTKFKEPEEAIYANSGQAVTYSLPIDVLFPEQSEYTVNYFVYSSSAREWNHLPFDKHLYQKAEALKTLMLQHGHIKQYQKLNYYPKNGEGCFAYGKRCPFFNDCDVMPENKLIPFTGPEEHAEPVDVSLRIEDLIENLKGK